MEVSVGARAPDFELLDQDKQPVRLSSFRQHKNVVIVFYPNAFTRICGGELCSLRDELAEFQNDGTQLLTISVDSPQVHKRWADEQGFSFSLLSDFWPHGEVARLYGVLDEQAGTAMRGTFIVDLTGTVRWKVVNGNRDPRNPSDYQRVLQGLG